MSNAKIDQNYVKTIVAENASGSKEIVSVSANPVSNGLKINLDTPGSNSGIDFASRDNNRVPVLIAVSALDGKTPVPIYADDNGAILIQ